jgi:type IX secretion system PorP/SprF family membrane protein
MKKSGLIFTLVMLGFSAAGQQVPSYSQYFLNPYLINPASAGASGETRIFTTFRNQWVGIPGAPETQALTVDGMIPDTRTALGLTLYNDTDNILSRVGGLGTYAYHLPLAKDHILSMGLSFGFIRTQIDFDRLRAENMFDDKTLLQSANHGTAFDGSAGLSYGFKRARIGVAALQLFQNNISIAAEPDKRIAYKLMRHYVITAQYAFLLNQEKLKLEPIVLLRSAQGLPAQVDVNLVATYRKNYWMAIGHKVNSSIGLALGTRLYDRLTVGYSYEYTTNSFNKYQNGSHEVMVGYTFRRNKTRRDDSGVNDSNDRLSRQNQAQYETIDQINQQNEQLQGDLKEQQRIVQSQKEEIDRLHEEMERTKREMDSVVVVSRINPHDEDFEKNSSANYYAVLGAFKTLRYAKQFQQIVRRELSLETSVVQKANGSYFFIYTKKIANRSEALAEMRRLRQINSTIIVGEPWVYKD